MNFRVVNLNLTTSRAALPIANADKIQSINVSSSLASTITDGQVMAYDASSGTFIPETVSGGGGATSVDIPLTSPIPPASASGVLIKSANVEFNQTGGAGSRYYGQYTLLSPTLLFIVLYIRFDTFANAGGDAPDNVRVNLDIAQLPGIELEPGLIVDDIYPTLGYVGSWDDLPSASFNAAAVGARTTLDDTMFEVSIARNITEGAAFDDGGVFKLTFSVPLLFDP